MALLHLAARWADGRDPAPRLHVATVDHGLRPDSRREADAVAAAAERLGLSHAILTWIGPKPTSRVQEKARAARYALLAERARAIGAACIVTAHHADDQAETVLLRLGRGSGIGGLAGMRRRVALAPGLDLARPLLGVTKASLVAFCTQARIPTIDDPSNRDEAFARSRIRARSAELAALGLDTPGLVRLARRMARADAALEAEADRVEGGCASPLADGAYNLDVATVHALPAEIALRVVRRAIARVAGADPAPIRLERLEALTDALWSALRSGRSHHATLAGVRLSLGTDGALRLAKERPRRRGSARGRD